MKSALLAAAVLAVLPLAAAAQAPAEAVQAPAYAASDWRTPDPHNVLVIDTSQGRVFVELSPLLAPKHVERYKLLARRGFYDGLEFFRVIDGFMAQTGDPKNDGTGGSDLPDLQAEFEFRRGPSDPFALFDKLPAGGGTGVTEVGFYGNLPVRTGPQMQMMASIDGKTGGWGMFCSGVAGAARAGDPDSANSQFFLMRGTMPSLNSQYTAFGRVIAGLDVVRKIKIGPEEGQVEQPRDKMLKVQILADMPAKDQPKIQVLDTRSPGFKAMVAAAKAKAGDAYTICEVEIPFKVG
jgi:peptidylprolyl isomerase